MEKHTIHLRSVLKAVTLLHGFLTMCASCKRIRNDDGAWQRFETSAGEHSEVQFTHGICPDCAKKLYPEYVDEYGNIL